MQKLELGLKSAHNSWCLATKKVSRSYKLKVIKFREIVKRGKRKNRVRPNYLSYFAEPWGIRGINL